MQKFLIEMTQAGPACRPDNRGAEKTRKAA
jgi:hypothetical protein